MVTLPFSLCVCFKVGISHYNMIRTISIGLDYDLYMIKLFLIYLKFFQHRLYKSMKERLYLDLVDS